MKKPVFFFIFTLTFQQVPGQCNEGLNLGTVIVPAHGNAANNGNFASESAWQQAAAWAEALNLDFSQRYITWTDIVSQINNHVPDFTYGTITAAFQNRLTSWAGASAVHVVYPTIKVGVPNTLENFPAGFGVFTSFLDTAYINQNYHAIKYILTNVNNVSWISIGNEIETYFGGAFLNTGRLTQYAQFLEIIKNRIHTDFPAVKVGTVLAFHTLYFYNQLTMIDSVVNAVDFVGYTFYYTTSAAQNCWDSPATVQTWLNLSKLKAGSKKLFITETCMGDGGGLQQNCGLPSKQLEYADRLLQWYGSHKEAVEGMTWFTVVDPYLGWQTPNTLWNTCGLVDSSGVDVQPAGMVWKHDCTITGMDSGKPKVKISFYPNPFSSSARLQTDQLLTNADLTLYNAYGQVVQKIENLSGYTITINRHTLPGGLYYLRLTRNKQVLSVIKLYITDD
jgi:hypothetical protein